MPIITTVGKSPKIPLDDKSEVNNSFVPDGTSKLVHKFRDMRDDDDNMRSSSRNRSSQRTARQRDESMIRFRS